MALAAMARGRSHLYGPLYSDDTRAMDRVLAGLGIPADLTGDPWIVDGAAGSFQVPDGPIDVDGSGLAARIAIAMATLVNGPVTIDGSRRLRERPMADLLKVLSEQGVAVTSNSGCLPVTVSGLGGLWGGELEVAADVSSQFVTALLLVSPMARNQVSVRVGRTPASAGYIGLTTAMMERFGVPVEETMSGFRVRNQGYQASDVTLEVDVSAAVYPMVGSAITAGNVELVGVRMSTGQPDIAIARHLETMGCRLSEGSRGLIVEGPNTLQPIDVDLRDAPDGALGLAVACLFASGASHLRGLSTLVHKESDRLVAMREELGRLGADVQVEDDTVTITPGELKGSTINPHGDHRIAMALALVGLRVPDVMVEGPEVVDKTWPGYWSSLTELVR